MASIRAIGLLLLVAGSAMASCAVSGTYVALKTPTAADSAYVNLWWSVVNNATLQITMSTNNSGWLGFGLSATGHMLGSDIAVMNLNDGTGQAQVHDYHVFWTPSPLVDSSGNPIDPAPTPQLDSQQDWSLICYSNSLGVTTYTISRSLVTTDATQDRPIVNGPMFVIFAWSSDQTNTLAFHHSGSRSTTQIAFLGSSSLFAVPSDTNGNSTLTFSGASVSSTLSTQYICQAFDTGTVWKHITAFQPLVTGMPGAPYAHHILLHGCGNNASVFPLTVHPPGGSATACQYSDLAHEGSSVLMNRACNMVLFEWALGGNSYALPDVAGFLLGADTRYVIMEAHVTNPTLVPATPFATGVLMHTTTNLRKYNATTMQFGDPSVRGFDYNTTYTLDDPREYASPRAIPFGQTWRHYEGNCPSTCLNLMMSGSVHAFRSAPHMHGYGRTAWLTLTRNGTTNVVDLVQYWNFGFQNTYPVNYDIQPTDSISFHCVYDTTRAPTSGVTWGPTSSNEMCMDFVSVYPRENIVPYALCGALYAPGRLPQNYPIFPGQIISVSICSEISSQISQSDGMTTVPANLFQFGPPATSAPTMLPTHSAAESASGGSVPLVAVLAAVFVLRGEYV